jgi:hypothetical protein
LGEKLANWTPREKSLLEPVLSRYNHVFHEEGSNEFKGTNLVEHQMITLWSISSSICNGKEIENKVHGMFKKGVIKISPTHWSAAAILVPK